MVLRRRAFTLIELLIVIAIIALLAAILFPVYGRVRENARRSSCQSNQKQVGLSIKQYLQDNDEKFPLSAVSSAPYGWADAIQPYLKNTQVLHCPSDPAATNPSPSGYGYSSYFYNFLLSGVTESKVVYSSCTIMNGDGKIGSSGDIGTARYALDGGTGVDQLADLSNAHPQRHLEGANYAFSDGHVKWLKGFSAAVSPVIYSGDTLANGNNYTFASGGVPVSGGGPTPTPTPTPLPIPTPTLPVPTPTLPVPTPTLPPLPLP